MPTLMVDIDNVLADYTDGLRYYLRTHGSTAPMPEPDDYDFERATGWELREGFRSAHKNAVHDGIYTYLRPTPHAVAALRHIHDTLGWPVVIATSRETGDARVAYQTLQWLAARGFAADAVHFGGKLDVRCDVAVDDRPETLRQLHETGVRVLRYAHAYNASAPGLPVSDMEDVVQALKFTDA